MIGLTKGAFRLATGSSPKKAYKIQTPLEAIGVRGTEIGVRSEAGYTLVTYYSGTGRVCSSVRKSNCLEVRRPGETIAVMLNGTVSRVKEPVLVNLLCSKSGGGAALCATYGNSKCPTPMASTTAARRRLPAGRRSPLRVRPAAATTVTERVAATEATTDAPAGATP